jgi:hypothetical protein
MPAGVTVRVVVKSLWLVGDSRCLAAWRVLSFTLISGSSPTSRLRCSGGHARATGGKELSLMASLFLCVPGNKQCVNSACYPLDVSG